LAYRYRRDVTGPLRLRHRGLRPVPKPPIIALTGVLSIEAGRRRGRPVQAARCWWAIMQMSRWGSLRWI